MAADAPLVRWFEDLALADLPAVGGKNASLGEMIARLGGAGIRVPGGFALTAAAYWRLLDASDLRPRIAAVLERLDTGGDLGAVGAEIRALLGAARVPDDVEASLRAAYRELGRRGGRPDPAVAVRSSATAEDLPEASFAGQQESFLNVAGEDALVAAARRCWASLFTDRAIAYRRAHGFDHLRVALSVGVQRMVRSDLGCSGVLFTLETETGFPGLVQIDGAWGLGESVVKGTVNPDRFTVFKAFLGDPRRTPIVGKALGSKRTKLVYGAASSAEATHAVETSAAEREAYVLTDEEILALARWGCAIEAHYGRPMDVEWAKDGEDGALYILQARPETVQSRREAGVLTTYRLRARGEPLVRGLSVGSAIATGTVCRIDRPDEIGRFRDGAILVTGKTDPDWVPLMRRAAGIVTDEGGRTSHAAIVCRELGMPAVIGTGDATRVLGEGRPVTLSCAEGGDQGVVYDGTLPFERAEVRLDEVPATRTRVMVNVASPAAALQWWRLPSRGVGLLRMEHIVGDRIGIHPMALARFDALDEATRAAIEARTPGYADKAAFFVDRLAWGVGTIAAVHHPEPVILRLSDFKTNEYAALVGGAPFEPVEANPMLGWRGASRYYSDGYRDGFALECRAVARVRGEMGFDNVKAMIPFCRTPEEADRVLATMAEHGLERGRDGLEVNVMCEIPSNVVLAEAFAERFDGFSIGSNDLTQLVLGVDRDAARLAELFDERHEAVRRVIADAIARVHAAGRPIGLCGQAPSDDPAFAEFLVDAGIDSISVTPDRVVEVARVVARREAERSGPSR